MTSYARIQDGHVAEKVYPQIADEDILQPNSDGKLVVVIAAGAVVPLAMLYTPEFIADLVSIPEGSQVAIGDSCIDGVFGPPTAPAAPVPTQVTMRQARLALLGAGKLSAVADAIAGLPSPAKETAQIEWDYAATVERASPFLKQVAVLLGLDDEALDELFTVAAQL